MTNLGTVTHTYTVADGWAKVVPRALTEEYARELRAEGVTLVNVRAGLFRRYEISLRDFA